YGYSWENDVWNPLVLAEVFHALCGVCRTTTGSEVGNLIEKCFADYERDLRWATQADFLCFQHGLPMLPRQSPMKIIRLAKSGNPPGIDKASIRGCIREARAS